MDTTSERTLWRDFATVHLNAAVLHSFDKAAVTITDHHAEALHRLAWLRSRQRPSAARPAFRLDPTAANRARAGTPAQFTAALDEPVLRPTGRLAELLRQQRTLTSV